MDPALQTAISQPDIDDVLLSAIDHADTAMRRYVWRGFRPKAAKADRELMVGDKTAKDFVNEALKRLCEGRRTYDSTRSLIDNLNSVTDSLIWTEKKSSDRTRIVDFADQSEQNDEPQDPISLASNAESAPDVIASKKETAEAQRQQFNSLLAAFDGDPDTQNYLQTLSQGIFDINQIAERTGLAVPQIYEIRRKLKKFAPKLFGVANFKEMKRKLSEGI